MNKKTFLIMMVIVLGVMYMTNPTMEDFSEYIQNEALGKQGGESKNGLERLAGALVEEVVMKLYSQDDYKIFSVYEGSMNILSESKNEQYIGVFKSFYKVQ